MTAFNYAETAFKAMKMLARFGGAVTLQTKDGRSHPGSAIETRAGTHGFGEALFEHGGHGSSLDWFVTGVALGDAGWREASPSRLGQLFGKLGCSVCHSFGGGETDGVGGIGPDLTGVGGRYGVRDILDSILNPSNVISNLYAAIIVHLNDGKQLTGKVIFEDDNEVALAENVFDLAKLDRKSTR